MKCEDERKSLFFLRFFFFNGCLLAGELIVEIHGDI